MAYFCRDGEDGDDDNDGFSFFGGDSKDPFEDSFFHFNDHIQKQMDAMSRQMEDMFKSFGSVQFPSGTYMSCVMTQCDVIQRLPRS